jgi:hypothetical protein
MLGAVNPRDIVQLEVLGKLKKYSMTSSGIEPAALRLVKYCLNQLRYCVPHKKYVLSLIELVILKSHESINCLKLFKKTKSREVSTVNQQTIAEWGWRWSRSIWHYLFCDSIFVLSH